MSKAASSTWHRHQNSSFEARISGFHDGPLDLDETDVVVEVAHESGRTMYVTVSGVQMEPGRVVVNLVDKDETFIHPDAIASITKALSLSTYPIIEWDGYVDEA